MKRTKPLTEEEQKQAWSIAKIVQVTGASVAEVMEALGKFNGDAIMAIEMLLTANRKKGKGE